MEEGVLRADVCIVGAESLFKVLFCLHLCVFVRITIASLVSKESSLAALSSALCSCNNGYSR